MRPSQARDKTDEPLDLHDALHSRFGWHVPEHFNMAQVCARRWADDPRHAGQTAVIATAPAGAREESL